MHRNLSKAVALHLLLHAAEPRREELRRRGPGTLGGQEGSEGMEALAGGVQTHFPGVDGPPQSGVHQGSKEAKPETGQVALLFGRLQFTLSYRPGSKNVKVDALSHLYDAEERQGEETSIIPPFRIIVLVVWDMYADIQQALCTEPAPAHHCD